MATAKKTAKKTTKKATSKTPSKATVKKDPKKDPKDTAYIEDKEETKQDSIQDMITPPGLKEVMGDPNEQSVPVNHTVKEAKEIKNKIEDARISDPQVADAEVVRQDMPNNTTVDTAQLAVADTPGLDKLAVEKGGVKGHTRPRTNAHDSRNVEKIEDESRLPKAGSIFTLKDKRDESVSMFIVASADAKIVKACQMTIPTATSSSFNVTSQIIEFSAKEWDKMTEKGYMAKASYDLNGLLGSLGHKKAK